MDTQLPQTPTLGAERLAEQAVTATKYYFGSQTRAQDGCIVTFALQNGETRVEHFTRLVRTRGARRKVSFEGAPTTEQAAARADELGAKIVSISTPETILRDLRGTRAQLTVNRTGRPGSRDGMQQTVGQSIHLPENSMLGKIGRLDLLRKTVGKTTLAPRRERL